MLKRAHVLIAMLLATGCASGGRPDIATLASNSDQAIWEAGQTAARRKQWENARQHFRRIIDGFPQSPLGPDARLALADSYVEEGGTASYILAVAGYREFLTFYPSHERADYAQFMAGESYFKQRNSPDRDQTATKNALEEYQRLLELYPTSSYIEQARERIVECRQTLARSQHMVGYFYQKTRKAYRAAASRYEGILDDYPDYAALDEVLFRLGEVLIFSARAPEAAPYLSRLFEEFPDSQYAPEARDLFEQIRAATPPPAASEPGPQPTPEAP